MNETFTIEYAEKILRNNDHGGYTIPTSNLYPFQWNWDSAFCALGWQKLDIQRAIQEIEFLLAGQWKNGMIPHILFHHHEPTYFPGPDFWEAGEKIPSSGYSQPPVLTSFIHKVWKSSPSTSPFHDKVQEWFPKLMDYHRWFWRERNPTGKGLICILHPWESGRDNLPDWSQGLENVDISKVKDFKRKDTEYVNSEYRPLETDYQYYLALVEIGKENEWDTDKMLKHQPFVMLDVLMTAVLLRSNQDLLEIGQFLNNAKATEEIAQWIEISEQNLMQLWNEKKQAFCSFDYKREVFIDHVSSASFVTLITGKLNDRTFQKTLDLFDRWVDQVNFAVPSFDPEDSLFEEKRYWTGPVWIIINYLIREGLLLYGEIERADRVLKDSQQLIAKNGFWEYYSAYTGEGLGGKEFSWTAAVWLEWMKN